MVNTTQSAPPKVIAQSPTEVMTALNEAAKTNDAATIKGLISKGTLALLEESAKQQGKPVDDLLKQDASMPFEETPEMRNEKIEGDTATVEVKNPATGEFDVKYPFVKEDGAWKLARDKYIEEEMKKANEETGKKLANSRISNNNSAPNANADNSVNK